jgi:multidrug efflux system membrane fusion protein
MSLRVFVPPVALCVVLASQLAGSGDPPPTADAPPVTVSQPVARKVTDYDEYQGRITAAPKVDVRARVRGYLTAVHFQGGQMVQQGHLLYELDPRPYRVALDAAEAQARAAEAVLGLAQAEYERARLLLSRGAASRDELDVWTARQGTARADVQKARAAVEQARLDLGFTRISAPISGKIGPTQVDVGNLVQADGETPLTTLVAVDPIYVHFHVDERALLGFRQAYHKDGKDGGPRPSLKELKVPIDVALEGERGETHRGVIASTDNHFNLATGTIEVHGLLSNADHFFEDGMRARVRVPAGGSSSALLVSERAVGTDQGRRFVYAVNGQNVVERRQVTAGRRVDGLLVIRDGLQADDWVIVNGIQQVRAGMKVQPQRAAMPGAKPAD